MDDSIKSGYVGDEDAVFWRGYCVGRDEYKDYGEDYLIYVGNSKPFADGHKAGIDSMKNRPSIGVVI